MFEMRFNPRAFERRVDELGAAFRRPTDFTERPFREWLAETEREQFRTEGGAGRSGRWPRLSPATLRRKSAEGRGFSVLTARGAMRDRLTSAGGLRQMIEVREDTIVFRFPPPEQYHQRGTRHMPQRKVIDPSAAQVQRLGEDVKREAVKVVRGLGINTKS